METRSDHEEIVRGDYEATVTLRESYFPSDDPIEEQLVDHVINQPEIPDEAQAASFRVKDIGRWGTDTPYTFEYPHWTESPATMHEFSLRFADVTLAIPPISGYHSRSASWVEKLPLRSDPTAPQTVLRSGLTAILTTYCEEVRRQRVDSAERLDSG